MTPMHVVCPRCHGIGHDAPSARSVWPLCPMCDGHGYTFADGAPRYGCQLELADRVPGEVVTLGNGDRGRVLWHSPRGAPSSTWIGLIGEFSGIESHRPVAYPSAAGVAEVHLSRARGDKQSHANRRSVDTDDPLQRQLQYSRGI